MKQRSGAVHNFSLPFSRLELRRHASNTKELKHRSPGLHSFFLSKNLFYENVEAEI